MSELADKLGWFWWFAAFYFLGSPLLIRLLQKQAARPELLPIEREAQGLPAEVGEYFDAQARELSRLGFAFAGYYALLGQTPNVNVVLAVWENQAKRIGALGSVMYAEIAGRHELRVKYVEFCTRFPSDQTLDTNNSGTIGCYGAYPGRRICQFPFIADCAQLFRVHEALVSEERVNCEPAFRTGNAAQDLAEAMRREMTQQVETGYLYLDSSGQAYRPTLKGAYLMTWKLLWPVSTVRFWLANRRARQWLARLDLAN